MLTAERLRLLADAADAAAEAGAVSKDRRQGVAIAASDARQMADAGSGFATRETMHVAMMLGNDRATTDRVHALTLANMPDYGEVPEDTDPETIARKVDEADALARSHLADALSELVEEMAGFDRLGLPDITAALARCAFWNVDWLNLARHYIGEEQLNPSTGGAR